MRRAQGNQAPSEPSRVAIFFTSAILHALQIAELLLQLRHSYRVLLVVGRRAVPARLIFHEGTPLPLTVFMMIALG